MFYVISAAVCAALAVGAAVAGKAMGKGAIGTLSAAVLGVLAFGLLASTSFVYVSQDGVGHLNLIYGSRDLPQGRVIALDGEKGPQAEILGPGFHFSPLIRVTNSFEELETVRVPEGYYGQIVARDGKPMPDGMFIAPAFPDDKVEEMLNAEAFLKEGGYRGPQETVLKPGTYRMNRYLFDVQVSDQTAATQIPAGHVGVVKSNIGSGPQCREEKVAATEDASGALSVSLVPRGCVGIWKESLLPGAYYLNRNAYNVTLVDTRVQTWEYQGGYAKRFIDLSVDQQGNIQQNERAEERPILESSADRAVFVKVEGWDIPVELRALVQVDANTAPIVVGSVGGLEEIEDRILTPTIRSIVRNVTGSNIRVPKRDADGNVLTPVTYEFRPTRVLDLIDNRDALESNIEEQVKAEGRKAGIEVREIRIGEPAIPPELLVSRLRQQLAGQLSEAYARETEAQQERIKTEQARATANQQDNLVKSQIDVQVATQREQEREALGRGERKFLEELARGQSAQAEVLWQDRVAMLQGLDKVLSALQAKPELVGLMGKLVPSTYVAGGDGLSGAAAIVGSAFQPRAVAPAQ